MSKLEELIQKYCPDGVEFVHLGDVMSISRGASPRPIQNYLTDDDSGIPWIKIGDVSPESKYISSTKERVTKAGAAKSRFLKKGSFILSNSMSFGRPYILGIDGCIHDGWISLCDFEKHINSGFLYYLLRSEVVQGFWMSKANSGGAVSNLNSDIVRSTPIPLPPLPVQDQIVKILDTYTEQQTALQLALQAELNNRLQQYNYYRDNLLSFESRTDVEWKRLDDVASHYTGLTYKPTDVSKTNHGTLVLRSTNIKEERVCFDDNVFVESANIPDRALAKEGDILICVRNGSKQLIGKAALIPRTPAPMAFGAFMTVLRAKDINNKYLFYLWQSSVIKKQLSTNDAMPINQITNKEFSKICIPVPSLAEQQRIVSILDRFDSLNSELVKGLQIEIRERKQQYEFYRDSLLSFRRSVS